MNDVIRSHIAALAHSGKAVSGHDLSWGELLEFIKLRYGDYVKLELGPGRSPTGWASIGLGPTQDPSADIYWDLEKGIPLPDESVDEVYSNQFLEHIHPDRQIPLMNDIWRVLKPGGKAEHCVPHFLSPYADGDPTHRTRFSEVSFQYYCLDANGEPFVDSFSDYGIKCRFRMYKPQIVRQGLDITVYMCKD